MLRSLSIRDFVIVDTLDLDFTTGFTVFTGETGAGKSILIDALALVLGERADAGVVREGAPRASVSATFSTHPALDAWLAERELNSEAEDGVHTVLLRRTVDAGGRSKAFINGAAATLAQLREVGDQLVDIHGQHAHQLLLRPDAQRLLFDAHAGLTQQAGAVAEAWRAWRACVRQREAVEHQSREMQLERERLEWQVGELDKLNPQPGEWEEIQSEYNRLSHAAGLIDGSRAALDALSEADGSVLSALNTIVHKLQQLADVDGALRDVLAALEPAQMQAEEAAHSLTRYVDRLELDPERLQAVDERMQALHATARKYRLPPEQLPDELVARRQQLDDLQAAQDLNKVMAREAAAKAAYLTLAQHLSHARKQAAQALSAAVTDAMQGLSMAGGSFVAALNALDEGQSHGLEQVEFLVAGHAGVSPRPLARVASGGELARISLAISVITSEASPTPTLIFDEVDTGIGGAVAEVVGRRLQELGRARQVLCVTHLPQVAAQAGTHLLVSKETTDAGDGSVTRSRIRVLDPAGRVVETARMLGGATVTATTLQHAEEMLAQGMAGGQGSQPARGAGGKDGRRSRRAAG
ncbi:DNA repair protein RecN [Cupriavidus necator]|uniref:DNA repair protein RecN n=2 Tax=Cupriavidus necator TaxID=106590 RepID=Q0KCJ9_CUPNH|nr:DNA repair protein RecN [Cupriavidus necator]QCC00174.1 DNA repair protein RecN [Cupriavidus necator H16]QQB77012.1 DNA repair protein RecN [Cupriavidus necator]WKA42027.1 DNA repair protein RecN [Cupriavidus necator]CAJ92272.1 ATPase DNA repair [Cupriavidus necator H16]